MLLMTSHCFNNDRNLKCCSDLSYVQRLESPSRRRWRRCRLPAQGTALPRWRLWSSCRRRRSSGASWRSAPSWTRRSEEEFLSGKWRRSAELQESGKHSCGQKTHTWSHTLQVVNSRFLSRPGACLRVWTWLEVTASQQSHPEDRWVIDEVMKVTNEPVDVTNWVVRVNRC